MKIKGLKFFSSYVNGAMAQVAENEIMEFQAVYNGITGNYSAQVITSDGRTTIGEYKKLDYALDALDTVHRTLILEKLEESKQWLNWVEEW
jgi:hypothetical protein